MLHTCWHTLRRCVVIAVLVFVPGIVTVSALQAQQIPPNAEPQQTVPGIRVDVTDAVADSGLMKELTDEFYRETGIPVRWGTLTTRSVSEAGQICEADAFINHLPEAEHAFMKSGFGKDWMGVFYSYHMLAGPKGNPARVPVSSILDAFEFIYNQHVTFASSRDETGTSWAEKHFWGILKKSESEIEPWYLKAPPTANALLPFAAQHKSYTLTDAWSWGVFARSFNGDSNPLELLIPADPMAANQFNIITVSPEKCPDIRYETALQFALWLLTPKVQQRIADFRHQGETLFFPIRQSVVPR